MKKYKLLLCGLIITGFLSSEMINADALSKHYIGIEIKTLEQFTSVETIEKASTLAQEYYNAGNINQCNGNEDGIVARLKLGTQTAGDLTISTGNTRKTWTQTETKNGHLYHLSLKSSKWTICKGSHSGSWYHN